MLVPGARAAGADDFGPLRAPDANGLRLPPGFRSRIVATADQQPVAASSYLWHRDPDGGAVFETEDGGWIYASNSERKTVGGVGVLRFDSAANLIDAYSILAGTSKNCAGGPTPWDAWLSCEEYDGGRVWECDPYGPSQGTVREGLGIFKHEAAAVDPANQDLYLTEDKPNGLLYRFTPTHYPSLSAGTLEAAEILDPMGQGAIQPGQVRPLAWHVLLDPTPSGGGVQNATHLPASERATRYQLDEPTAFDGGEGCWYQAGSVYISTKGNGRIWRIDCFQNTIEIIYDFATTSRPELRGVDNVYAAATGDVYVAEDGGNMQLIALTPSGDVKPVVEVTGQPSSEITGPALTADGQHLYFSSQRAPTPTGDHGITYEVTGSFAPSLEVPGLGGLARGLVALALGGAAALRLHRSGEDEPDPST